MNTTLAEASQLVNGILENAPQNGVEKIFFPPFPFAKPVADLISGKSGFSAGAQNCSEHAKGAYTGEVSAAMLASVGCRYVLVGHSERRTYFKESGEQLVMKVKEALANHLQVVFCFGEQLAERKSNKHFDTVKQQLEEVLSQFKEPDTGNVILAYEPVWAIGTGETASPQQAQEMHAYVRKCIASIFSENVAADIPILYGGSCNAQNAPELFACPDVDGGLIGGASLKADDFCKITTSFP
jgi:triosephosphate isomerase